jgi:hypothetical protein
MREPSVAPGSMRWADAKVAEEAAMRPALASITALAREKREGIGREGKR